MYSPADYVSMYAEIVADALPLAFVFGIGNLLCNMVASAAFRGKLVIGAGDR